MALIQFDFKSEALGLASSVAIAFSQRIAKAFGRGHRSPVLYLLHGLSDDHTTWLRRTSIERYAEAYDLFVVMPNVHRSFYINTYSGYRYFDFIADELPQICRDLFHISADPRETFVAGLSMGGYGAFRLALSRPDQYAAAASLSGALDLASLGDERDSLLPEWASVFGPTEAFHGGENDLLHLALQCRSNAARMPRLYQCCGTEDYLFPANQSFLRHCREIRLPVDYEEGPGEHEWGYWDQQIQRVLQWLPLQGLEDVAQSPLAESNTNR